MGMTFTGEAVFNQFVTNTRKFSNALNSHTFEQELLIAIGKAAKLYLEAQYMGIDSTQQVPTVDVIYDSPTTATLVASGNDVMFIEFGTGTEGLKNSYPDVLPNADVPITGNWVYNYPSSAKIYAKSGAVVWRVPDQSKWGSSYVNQKGYTKGIPSFHQIYDTAVWLETFIPDIFEQLMRKYYV